ncbi:MAG: RHS repeat-associated core domain-containing protein, partial [Methylocella sp.]
TYDAAYTFGYTDAHQLQSQTAASASIYQWQPPAAASTAYGAANNLNQYPSVAGVSYAYDGKGNLTGDGTWTYAYDAENRLLTANKSTGGAVAATYAYDPFGRRVHKSGAGVTETFFVDSGTDEIAEYDSTGTLVTRYVPGPAIDDSIAEVTAGMTRNFIHRDRQGSVILTSSDGGARASGPFAYDAYGNCFVAATGAPCSGGLPYRFTGQRLDRETGLYYDRARYYSSALGRFPQSDPIGYTADPNLYTYVGNDPTDHTDPSGKCLEDACVVEGGVVVVGGLVVITGCVITGTCQQVGRWLNKQYQDYIHRNEQTPPVKDIPGNKPPFKGDPGSTVRGGTGTRTYGPDGYPQTDREPGHPDEAGPGRDEHSHDWTRPEGGGPPVAPGQNPNPYRGPARAPQPGDPPSPRGPNVPPQQQSGGTGLSFTSVNGPQNTPHLCTGSRIGTTDPCP